MADRESVITHLQIIRTWAKFARKRDLQFFTAKHLEDIAEWADDAITLLKEQEIVHCRECKWYERCELNDLMLNHENGFCADGERK